MKKIEDIKRIERVPKPEVDAIVSAENAMNSTGLEFYDLSHPWGLGQPCWPYFEDVKIERLHNHARSGVLTQRITTVMHSGTHIDAPNHVIEGTPFMDQMPLPRFFGKGVVVSIPKKKWEVVTAEDLENVTPAIEEGDIVIINTGWHHTYADSSEYYHYGPGLYKCAGEWLAAKKVKMVGIDVQALDHPLGTAIGPHGPGPLIPKLEDEYKEFSGGRSIKDDFPHWEPCHRALLGNGICGIENVGGELDKVTGKRCTIAAFPWRWVGGDGCIVRLVAMLDPTGDYRIEPGSAQPSSN
jgi:kynurenine formamidase